MDNPQHYQPLSHALHPPSTSRSIYSTTVPTTTYVHPPKPATNVPSGQPEEDDDEEEEEEDDDDEGLVEEQLNRNDADVHGSNHSSPKAAGNVDAQTPYNHSSHDDQSAQEPERKRRPGRPRGSKNRRPRVGSAKHEAQFYYHGQSSTPAATGASPSSAPPQQANMNPQNQQYYEFQWRVLNLCAEFYGAAEELVKATTPLVVAQCYHMGPGAKVDPLTMLADAKRVCDLLLANPSHLVTNPPPSMYPVLPTPVYQPIVHHPPAPVASTSSVPPPPASVTNTNPPSVITNAQTFVVPLGTQAAYQHPQYAAYAPAAVGPYPTTPYYHQYGYTPAGVGVYYQSQAPVHAAQPAVAQPHATPATVIPPVVQQPTATITTTPATGGTVVGNQGAWSEEETERLKKLAEESRSKGSTGEIEWDWVTHEWGISRTRHQILIKATNLGLKESSTRGTKRRREDGPSDAPSISSVPSTSAGPSNATIMPSTSSPSQSGSTPAASPALQSLQRPTSAKGAPPTVLAPPPKMPWPMPTVAVNTPSPVVATTSSGHDQQQRTSYYRPRPNQTDSSGKAATPAMHHYMYTPNGQGSGLRKENGK
ncbi:hypothetical protein B0H34DRAFT_147652 [Crassisporium funariophilum]|nr:hypothetical protein B0H34DRAFT_147652 [Crassisporium funariophilum]